ncbi:pilus assembly protein TadG-related protein [Streptomyces sodiiphilus]|uniref:Pilus assembly protein TadG-related protein n=2 Tax=Streptomyces sodiiphilus TaxID=226217 RepID=A0ABN2NW69_9ACTN
MVSGLLLIAFLFFVFAQAAFTRSGAQSAADAAALAAAHEARDRLHERFVEALEGEENLDEVLDARDFAVVTACSEAAPRLAGRNNADVISCTPVGERTGYTVGVETRYTVGRSVLPGTETQTAQAQATAVLEPLCEATTEEDDHIELSCEEGDWTFAPDDEDARPEPRDLFQVHLED